MKYAKFDAFYLRSNESLLTFEVHLAELMAPTTMLNFSVRSLLPKDVNAAAAVRLIQDHDAYISLDDHILQHTRLGGQTVEGITEIREVNGISEWLRSEVQKIVLDSSKGQDKNDRAQKRLDIEFWELETAHPFGRFLSNFR